jgi:hypothetical protein
MHGAIASKSVLTLTEKKTDGLDISLAQCVKLLDFSLEPFDNACGCCARRFRGSEA